MVKFIVLLVRAFWRAENKLSRVPFPLDAHCTWIWIYSLHFFILSSLYSMAHDPIHEWTIDLYGLNKSVMVMNHDIGIFMHAFFWHRPMARSNPSYHSVQWFITRWWPLANARTHAVHASIVSLHDFIIAPILICTTKWSNHFLYIHHFWLPHRQFGVHCQWECGMRAQ